MTAKIYQFPIRISKSFDAAYFNPDRDKEFIRAVVRKTYSDRIAVAVSAGEDAACAALDCGMEFNPALRVAREAIETVEKILNEYMKESR